LCVGWPDPLDELDGISDLDDDNYGDNMFYIPDFVDDVYVDDDEGSKAPDLKVSI